MYVKHINANDLTERMTLTVKVVGLVELKIRVAIGLFFIRLAAKIIGTGIKVDVEK